MEVGEIDEIFDEILKKSSKLVWFWWFWAKKHENLVDFQFLQQQQEMAAAQQATAQANAADAATGQYEKIFFFYFLHSKTRFDDFFSTIILGLIFANFSMFC